MSRESPLTESLVSLSRFLVSDSTMQETLHRVSELCVAAVPAAQFVGITMMVEGRARTAVFTDSTSPEIDQAQYDSGEGPCLEAFRQNRVTRIDDTTIDGPWPDFRVAASGRGIRSTLSLPLSTDRGPLGALNMYSPVERGFSPVDEQTAGQFAEHASVVLANADAYWDAHHLSQRLDQAMQARSTIEQAKGILMGAQRCGPDEAFQLLVRASQRENVKLRDIAARIVAETAKPPQT